MGFSSGIWVRSIEKGIESQGNQTAQGLQYAPIRNCLDEKGQAFYVSTQSPTKFHWLLRTPLYEKLVSQ